LPVCGVFRKQLLIHRAGARTSLELTPELLSFDSANTSCLLLKCSDAHQRVIAEGLWLELKSLAQPLALPGCRQPMAGAADGKEPRRGEAGPRCPLIGAPLMQTLGEAPRLSSKRVSLATKL
jgi:hypothetical protein